MNNKEKIIILKELIKEFYPFARKRLGFNKKTKIILKNDNKNAKNPLGKTAYYNPEDFSITVYVSERHPKDIMRSLSHELVHHTQNCKGQFNDAVTEEGYAQKDKHLREMEKEAYEQGNIVFRDWEDMRDNNDPNWREKHNQVDPAVTSSRSHKVSDYLQMSMASEYLENKKDK